jgi:hypothetical protein
MRTKQRGRDKSSLRASATIKNCQPARHLTHNMSFDVIDIRFSFFRENLRALLFPFDHDDRPVLSRKSEDTASYVRT